MQRVAAWLQARVSAIPRFDLRLTLIISLILTVVSIAFQCVGVLLSASVFREQKSEASPQQVASLHDARLRASAPQQASTHASSRCCCRCSWYFYCCACCCSSDGCLRSSCQKLAHAVRWLWTQVSPVLFSIFQYIWCVLCHVLVYKLDSCLFCARVILCHCH